MSNKKKVDRPSHPSICQYKLALTPGQCFFPVTLKSARDPLFFGRVRYGHFRFFTGTFSRSFTGQRQLFTAIISKIVTGIVAKVTGILNLICHGHFSVCHGHVRHFFPRSETSQYYEGLQL